MRKIRRDVKMCGERGSFRLSLFLSLSLVASGCGANQGILKAGTETPVPSNGEDIKSSVVREIDAMRTAGFNFIFVLRRKDGGTMDADDRSVIKANTASANRRVSVEEDKAFVIGSNPPIPPDNFGSLGERFAVENYSFQAIPVVNINSNVRK